MTGDYLLREIYIHPMNSRRALEVLRSSVGDPTAAPCLLGAFYAVGISGSMQFKVLALQTLPASAEVRVTAAEDGVRIEQRRLRPAPGPDPLSTDAARCAAPLFAYEITTVRPGAGESYLDAVRAEREPILGDHGHRLIGAFTTVGESHAVTMWACDVDAHIRLQRAYDAAVGLDDQELADDRLLAWRRRARQFIVGPWREHLMVPFPGSVLAPR